MNPYRRREFLADVGRGMLVASVGSAVAQDLGLASSALADDAGDRLTFGPIEPLVALMQETPAGKLLPILVERMNTGTDLRQMVAAAALANARAFGGQDYEGYHAIMALLPAYQMSRQMPEGQRALPVMKVLYRNTDHIQEMGGRSRETLRPVEPLASAEGQVNAEALRMAVRRKNFDGAERTFAALARGSIDDAYNDLQLLVQDDDNVHRVVLAWRAWALLDLTGKEHAHTLLRQSVRFCIDEGGNDPLQAVLPRLLDEHKFVSKTPGDKQPGDDWIERMSHTIYSSSKEKAAAAAAEALADGIAPEAVGEAISLAANQLVLHDPGRKKEDSPDKPIGSVHGASVGVHASDAANAWRNIARVSNRRNTYASMIVGAYHTAGQASGQYAQPYPFKEHREKVADVKPDALLAEAETAIKAKDQTRACALVHRYGELGQPEGPVFDVLLRYAISEDGALHAEKYYRTVVEEFATTRPALRWRQLAALARVTASEYGHPAPGVEEARQLLKA
jgi:flagellar basal body rod protein FlgC